MTLRRWMAIGLLALLASSGCACRRGSQAGPATKRAVAPSLDDGAVFRPDGTIELREGHLERLSEAFNAEEGPRRRGRRFHQLASTLGTLVLQNKERMPEADLTRWLGAPDRVLVGEEVRGLVYRFNVSRDDSVVIIGIRNGIVESFGWNSYAAAFPNE